MSSTQASALTKQLLAAYEQEHPLSTFSPQLPRTLASMREKDAAFAEVVEQRGQWTTQDRHP